LLSGLPKGGTSTTRTHTLSLHGALPIGGYMPALERLEAVFRDPDPATLPMKAPLIRPIAALYGEHLSEELGTLLQATSMGMGMALNHDSARRTELLGLESVSDDGATDFTRFDVDFDTLEQALMEGFLPPHGSQNDSPTSMEFVRFMQEFPECRAHGYAIGPERPDYRVAVEGLRCDFDDVDEDRRAEIAEAFEMLCRDPDLLEMDESGLYSWWD